jgi:ATP-dependent protease ClpP protease subunit
VPGRVLGGDRGVVESAGAGWRAPRLTAGRVRPNGTRASVRGALRSTERDAPTAAGGPAAGAGRVAARREADVGIRVPDLGALLAEAQMRRMALDATGAYFVTNIDPPHAEDFAKSLLLMAVPRRGQHDQPITVYVNSGGGSVGDGLAMMEMINRMRRSYDVRINTVVLGYAYSMGAIVSQAGDHRSIGRYGTLMLHSTQWILSGEDERIFKDYQELSEHYQRTVADLFARRTAYKDAAWWRRFIWSGRERFLGPDECLELGLVDEILEPALLHEAHPTL